MGQVEVKAGAEGKRPRREGGKGVERALPTRPAGAWRAGSAFTEPAARRGASDAPDVYGFGAAVG